MTDMIVLYYLLMFAYGVYASYSRGVSNASISLAIALETPIIGRMIDIW
jgi:hypothetical protein